jgi:multiple sugar transport system substrate-binding protein
MQVLNAVAARESGPPVGRHLTVFRMCCLVGLLALAGCGAPPESGGPVTLVLKHAKILGPVDPIPRLLTEFEALHPGVRIKAEVLPWSPDEQRQFLVINLEGGRAGFDVMMLDCIWVPEFARAGWLLDLTPSVSPGEMSAHFPSAVEAGTYRGRTWALPWFMNVGLLYYRTDLLARYGFRPPET